MSSPTYRVKQIDGKWAVVVWDEKRNMERIKNAFKSYKVAENHARDLNQIMRVQSYMEHEGGD